MQCFVFKPRRHGKTSPLFSGRYRFDDMPQPREVPLYTPDKLVALKRLQDFITRKQRESEGLAAPAPMRAAQSASFGDLVAEYALDLRAQGRDSKHAKDTAARLRRLSKECKWARLGDVTPAALTTWRGRVADSMSAKTLKEYHVSLDAFFAWLVQSERYDRNPVAKVRKPATRGRQTRTRRAFTPDEARRLLAVSEHHRVPYLTMLYTGLRYQEAFGLRWCDLVTDGGVSYIVISADKTKNRTEARIPVRPELLAEIDTLRTKRSEANPARRIFAHVFPGLKTTAKKPNALRRDLAAAGIPVFDARGHVLDYHSFRKTWNTWAAVAGVPQRSAQAVLRHSTPDLTAGPYTDLNGLGLAAEMDRLEWIGAPKSAQENPSPVSGEISGELATEIAEALAAQFLRMVDPTGLESGKAFTLQVLGETFHRLHGEKVAAKSPLGRLSANVGHGER